MVDYLSFLVLLYQKNPNCAVKDSIFFSYHWPMELVSHLSMILHDKVEWGTNAMNQLIVQNSTSPVFSWRNKTQKWSESTKSIDYLIWVSSEGHGQVVKVFLIHNNQKIIKPPIWIEPNKFKHPSKISVMAV